MSEDTDGYTPMETIKAGRFSTVFGWGMSGNDQLPSGMHFSHTCTHVLLSTWILLWFVFLYMYINSTCTLHLHLIQCRRTIIIFLLF